MMQEELNIYGHSRILTQKVTSSKLKTLTFIVFIGPSLTKFIADSFWVLCICQRSYVSSHCKKMLLVTLMYMEFRIKSYSVHTRNLGMKMPLYIGTRGLKHPNT